MDVHLIPKQNWRRSDGSAMSELHGQWSSFISCMPDPAGHSERTEYRMQSRFISEIPEHLIKHVDRYRSPFRQSAGLYEVVREEDRVDYRVDQIVLHPQFGRGKITKISRSGHGVYVTVRFSRAGMTKQLDPSLTPLTITDY